MFLLGVKIIHLIDRTDLFKSSNLVLDGKEILTSLYSSLEDRKRKRDTERSSRTLQGFIRVKTRERALLK